MQAKTALLQNRYEIVRPIAQGGMGAVYEGRDWRLGGSAVALKLCVFNSEQMRDIFEHEANLLARLSHPNLPGVRDLFNEGAGQYIVMEYVSGTDLDETLKNFGGVIAYRTVLAWADQLLDTLAYLHQHEPPLIHRDIKPANIKLTPQGNVMLLDFGPAKGHTSNLDLYDRTSAYAPIEQIHNSGTDQRSDLYALASTLFRLLTGKSPVNALMRFEAIAAHLPDPQKLASEIEPSVPLIVSQAIHQALALNREARFQSAQEMRTSLRLALKTALPPEPQTYATATPEALAVPPEPELHAQDAAEPVTTEVGTTKQSETINEPKTQPPPIEPPFVPPPIFVRPAAKMTTTVQVPPANLATRRSSWRAATLGIGVLLFGGTVMGLMAQQFLGRSSAEPPKAVVVTAPPTAPQLPQVFTNRFGTRFTLVPAGKFTMGSPNEADAQPPHIVTFAQPFYLSTYEITQQQWRSIMRTNPSENKNDASPVENISWFDAQKFIAQLNLLNDGYRYRLPSEAEWEYAARGGSAEDAPQELSRFAWFNANAPSSQPVGQKEYNGFGLHDMLGNVAEWCADAYHETYAGAPTNGEAWTAASGVKMFRVIRGESWYSPAEKVHAAYRNYDEPHNRSSVLGLRLVAEKLTEPATP